MKKVKQKLKASRYGAVMIMCAAALWAVDPVIRISLSQSIPPAAIVFYEHLFGFILLSPFIYWGRNRIMKLDKKDWLVIITMSALSSVIGGYLFTEALSRSFAVFDFVSPILLQKLQPVFVILLSGVLLKEKINWKFLAMLPIILIASYMVDFGANSVALEFGTKQTIYLLAIGAAFAWGAGTIMSKYTLKKLQFEEAAALRFGLAVPISLLLSFITNQTYTPMNLSSGEVGRFILIALTTGAAAILLYYRGLKVTEAKVSTIAELTFPVTTLLIGLTSLNPYGEAQDLPLANAFGVVILLVSILVIAFDNIEYKKA